MRSWILDWAIMIVIVGLFGLQKIGGGAAEMARVMCVVLIIAFLAATLAGLADGWPTLRHHH